MVPVKYAKRMPEKWVIEVVDRISAYSWRDKTKLGFDKEGKPVIVYPDKSHVKIATLAANTQVDGAKR